MNRPIEQRMNRLFEDLFILGTGVTGSVVLWVTWPIRPR
jgi:hypothetical protein